MHQKGSISTLRCRFMCVCLMCLCGLKGSHVMLLVLCSSNQQPQARMAGLWRCACGCAARRL
jgi:hypothetical protein